ncbi:MAG TPA: hypothetical protein VK802_20490 [Streptosporangiaceae bacterium]|nr:hypothetical protein [Streptosporangiaceae bacterium]
MTDAAHGAREEQFAPSEAAVSPLQAVLSGLRQPIVLILLLIAFFTTISGKPLDGFLMLTVATLLVWDAARTRLGYLQVRAPSAARAPVPPARRRRLLVGASWVSAGLLYAGIVGSFKRYSWPATAAVVALGCLMVAIGWQGPLRDRAQLTGNALRRVWLWAVVLVAGGLWELSSLLQQPHLTTDSYAHPTISALTDPLLASHPGRSLALGGWLLIGWFLAGR